MKKLIITLCVMSGMANASNVESGNIYKLDSTHSFVEFQYNHLGFSNPSGKIMATGTINYESSNLTTSKVDINIDLTSLNTGVEKLDDHLKSTEFFNIAKYKSAYFISSKITPIDAKHFTMVGNLSLHGITKPITLQVTQNAQGINPISKLYSIGYSATGSIKRSDFGLGDYVPAISDDVTLNIEVEAHK